MLFEYVLLSPGQLVRYRVANRLLTLAGMLIMNMCQHTYSNNDDESILVESK